MAKQLLHLVMGGRVVDPQGVEFQDGSVFLKTNLPAHGVAAITIDFNPQKLCLKSQDSDLGEVGTVTR